jgi:hypothetical protein
MKLCKILGHKPIRPFPGMPAYCKHCLKDMSRRDGKWVINEQAFEQEFVDDFRTKQEG